MDLSNQEIRFNILISNIQQILSQTNEIAGNLAKLQQPTSNKDPLGPLKKGTEETSDKFKTLQQQIKETKTDIERLSRGFEERRIRRLRDGFAQRFGQGSGFGRDVEGEVGGEPCVRPCCIGENKVGKR